MTIYQWYINLLLPSFPSDQKSDFASDVLYHATNPPGTGAHCSPTSCAFPTTFPLNDKNTVIKITSRKRDMSITATSLLLPGGEGILFFLIGQNESVLLYKDCDRAGGKALIRNGVLPKMAWKEETIVLNQIVNISPMAHFGHFETLECRATTSMLVAARPVVAISV